MEELVKGRFLISIEVRQGEKQCGHRIQIKLQEGKPEKEKSMMR